MRPVDATRPGYCLLISTVCEGVVPYERDARGLPVIYGTLGEAQRELVDGIIERLEQFLSGEREFCDAMTVAEYIAEVTVYADGAVGDEAGNLFNADAQDDRSAARRK